MKSIVKIGNHYVVRGMSMSEYAQMVEVPATENYDELSDSLEEFCEANGGCDPLWDFPLEEMKDGTVEDNGCLYVELFDGKEPRYFETLIPLDNWKEILD